MAGVRTSSTKDAGACIPHIYCSQEGEISDMQIHSGKHLVQPKEIKDKIFLILLQNPLFCRWQKLKQTLLLFAGIPRPHET